MPIRKCERCEKDGENFKRCSRCKSVYYCTVDCQKEHWNKHRPDCDFYRTLPAPPAIEVVADYVECETYEQCRDFLIHHLDLINKKTIDEMYEKAFYTLGDEDHPVAIGARFIRNAQILQYLLDIRKASSNQQDISLFFNRILANEHKNEHMFNFEKEWRTLTERIVKRHKEIKAKYAAKAAAEEAAKEAEGSGAAADEGAGADEGADAEETKAEA
jgi:Cdc37 Hsp90 binding domain/MYND finger